MGHCSQACSIFSSSLGETVVTNYRMGGNGRFNNPRSGVLIRAGTRWVLSPSLISTTCLMPFCFDFVAEIMLIAAFVID